MEKEPSRRYASAAELAWDLGHFLKGEPVTARRPSLAGRTVGWFQRHSWVGTALLIVGVLVLAFLAYGLWEQTRFLTWQHANPGVKRGPGSLTKLIDWAGRTYVWLYLALGSRSISSENTPSSFGVKSTKVSCDCEWVSP